jgi:hypothetical protein
MILCDQKYPIAASSTDMTIPFLRWWRLKSSSQSIHGEPDNCRAPGPAKGIPAVLFETIAEVLAEHVDLFVGDFNYQRTGQFCATETTARRLASMLAFAFDRIGDLPERTDLILRRFAVEGTDNLMVDLQVFQILRLKADDPLNWSSRR